eukprot:6617550-Prymnesium_polylepis.1
MMHAHTHTPTDQGIRAGLCPDGTPRLPAVRLRAPAYPVTNACRASSTWLMADDVARGRYRAIRSSA